MNDSPIAIFDSGVGGLTVFKAIRDILPGEDILYLGDTARVPYGIKSADTVARYTFTAAEYLARRGAKMLVIGCNTATSAALEATREKFAPMPVIGVIEPGASAAVKASRNGRIAVIGTEVTIRDGAYQKAIGKLRPDAQVIGRACTLFVSLAEEGWLEGPIAEGIARRYLEDIFSQDEDARPDTLLLGCTHFPLLAKALQTVIGQTTNMVDSAIATARVVRDEMGRLGLYCQKTANGASRFLTTDNPLRFTSTGARFLRGTIKPEDVELVDL